jgi:hypothetical protein
MNVPIVLTIFALTASAIALEEFPLARTTPAKTAPFAVDLAKDFHFELGRGSGMAGLDTIAFGRDGIVTLYRQRSDGRWQTATLRFTPDAIARVFGDVSAEGIMKLNAAYHADVDDGIQWVLWITQGSHSKAVYLDNYFPLSVRRLAERLDSELANAGLPKATWKKVPADNSREHEQALWRSIK